MDFRTALRPYTVRDSALLATACLRAHADLPPEDDGWRRREWPFCDVGAAGREAAALSLQTLPGGLPAAWTITGPGGRPVGVIAATLYDEADRCALVGTYIAPAFRGLGVQLAAKKLLGQRLAGSVDSFYCLVRPDNAPALRALAKIQGCARLGDPRALPARLRAERLRMGGDAEALRIDLPVR